MNNRPNIVLLTIDCARQDMLYGSEVKTPFIDSLREQGVTFFNAFSQANVTFPSLVSVLTGEYVSNHGIISNFPNEYVSIGKKSFPFLLAREGWDTKLFSGYDILDQIVMKDIRSCIKNKAAPSLIHKKKSVVKSIKKVIKPLFRQIPPLQEYMLYKMNMRTKTKAETLVSNAMQFFKNNDGNPFFCWMHFFDAHLYYTAPRKWIKYYLNQTSNAMEKVSSREIEREGYWIPQTFQGFRKLHNIDYFKAYYMAGLSYIDEQIGRLLESLQSFKSNTVVIVTADHGENLCDNGVYFGHQKLFDETTKIPLIISDPDFKEEKEIHALVQHIDLMPSILQRTGVDSFQDSKKATIYDCISQGGSINEYVISEHSRLYQRTLRTKEWQYIVAHPYRKHSQAVLEDNLLLNRANQKDKKNYAHDNLDICEKFKEILAKELREPSIVKKDGDFELQLEKLKSLGYM